MANLTQTAANVKHGGGAGALTTRERIAGESITQGMPYYISTADNKAYKAIANDGSAKADARGIALTPASANGAFTGGEDGLINIGATLAVGTSYYVSTTAGSIWLESDLATGHFTTFLGIAISTSVLDLNINASGVQKP